MKLWKGRFTKTATSSANEFNASIGFDQRLYAEDIKGSLAHAGMLNRQGILTDEDFAAITEGLKSILADIEADNGKVNFTVENEDIHMNIETELTARIGEAGKRLHTARSRNDQVATDNLLYEKKVNAQIRESLAGLRHAIFQVADANRDTVMPGYTHMQKAQPVTLAYHMLAYYDMFGRDIMRLEDAYAHSDFLPLGSAAFAGTTYNTDRVSMAPELGFADIYANAMDAVSDRDHMIELIGCCSIIMMHLSRMCEELVIWSTNEFGFIEIDDAYSTGSSIMPQKKNPDMAELIRGKTGRVYGNLMSILTTMKGLPMAYNKDMQEDKPPLFDTIDTVIPSIDIAAEMLATMKVNSERMYAGADKGFTNATDAADYLVTKGIPFRDCHEIIGKMVLYCIQNDKGLLDLSMEEFKSFSDRFEEDIYQAISIETCVAKRTSAGATGFDQVNARLDAIAETEK